MTAVTFADWLRTTDELVARAEHADATGYVIVSRSGDRCDVFGPYPKTTHDVAVDAANLVAEYATTFGDDAASVTVAYLFPVSDLHLPGLTQ